MKRLAAAALLALLGVLPVHAAVLGLPDTPGGFVTDTASLLSEEQRTSLEADLQVFAASTSIEIAVVTVPSLQGDSVDRVAVELFEAWGIGDPEKDTGVLLLVAAEDREARIEVGYGLEGSLTDAAASSILRNDIFPAFREERYGDGIVAGVSRIQGVTQGEALPAEEPQEDFQTLFTVLGVVGFLGLRLFVAIVERSKSWWLGGLLGGGAGLLATWLFSLPIFWGIGVALVLVVAGSVLDFIVSRGYVPGGRGSGSSGGSTWTGGGWGGGSSGGGFGGFGGGSSGGGGASGRW